MQPTSLKALYIQAATSHLQKGKLYFSQELTARLLRYRDCYEDAFENGLGMLSSAETQGLAPLQAPLPLMATGMIATS